MQRHKKKRAQYPFLSCIIYTWLGYLGQ